MYKHPTQEQREKFIELFGKDLNDYWHKATGFKITNFSDDQYPGFLDVDVSLRDLIFEEVGKDGVDLILELIKYEAGL